MEDDRSQVSDGLYMTVDQYLALDEATDGKYEYLDGYAFMLRPPSSLYDDLAVSDTTMLDMTEGSVAHAALCAHMAWVLSSALADSPCMIYSGDVRLKLAERRYVYADITVACSEQTGTMLTNPVVLIEVLSPPTEHRDRGAKLSAYTASPTVQEYVLIGSAYKAIEIHRRDGTSWRRDQYREGDMVELKSLGVSFPFDEVYRRMPL
jgi:Uma2 family endonuclease